MNNQVLPNPYNINTINSVRNKLGFSGNPLQVFYLEYSNVDNNSSLNKYSKHPKLLKKLKSAATFFSKSNLTFIGSIESTGLLLLELAPEASSFASHYKFIAKNGINQITTKHINDFLNEVTITYQDSSLIYQVPVHVGLIDQPKNEQELKRLFEFKATHQSKPTNVGYMFCHHCGKKISADALFCHYCGAKQQPEVTNQSNHLYYDLQTASPKYSDADSNRAVLNYVEKMGFEPHNDYYTTCEYSYSEFIYDFNEQGLIIFMVEYNQGDRYTSSYYDFTGDNAFVPNSKIHSVKFKHKLLKLYVYLNNNPQPIRFTIPKFMKKSAQKLEQRFINMANK